MATTKIIPDLTALNKEDTTKSLKMPSGGSFSGTASEGMLRNDTSQSSELSASTMQYYNGTDWKNFVNISNCTSTTCQFPTSAASDAVALYQFEDNSDNSCSGGPTSSPQNITYGTPAKFTKAAQFNGSTSYIGLGNDAYEYTTNFTISAWIYPTAAQTGVIFSNYESGGSPANSGWTFRFNSNQKVILFGYGSQSYGIETTTTVSLNTWTNVVGTWDGAGSSNIYFNGVNQSVDSSSFNAAYGVIQYNTGGTGNPADFGRLSYTGGDSSYFNGAIDQIRIYNATLNATQVGEIAGETC